jgi:hypothetical protein
MKLLRELYGWYIKHTDSLFFVFFTMQICLSGSRRLNTGHSMAKEA